MLKENPSSCRNVEKNDRRAPHRNATEEAACRVLKDIVPAGNQIINQDFFQTVPGGKFSMQQLCFRDQALSSGVYVRRDIGVTFYYVQKGDTLSGIKEKLVKLPEFEYLKDLPAASIRSFNIPPRFLQLGMWIPIPPKESPSKNLDDKAFVNECRIALKDLQSDPVYGDMIKTLLLRTSENEILAMMLAVAKVECGGKLAQFATSRYEKDHRVFSYSVFHVLMEGAGLRARQKLNLTEGQLEHPRNAAKLFLAFLIEKSGKKIGNYFPLIHHYEDFATMYNGKFWPQSNPDYPVRLKNFHQQALKLIKA